MVDTSREHELAARRLMEAVFGHRRADDRARLYATATVGDLLERLASLERERDHAVEALRRARRHRPLHAEVPVRATGA
jgi:hypothetical protein